MAKHSPVSPSTCERFWNCPGSVQMQEGLPQQTSSYAAEGTIAHALGALCLENKRDPMEFVGEELEDGDIIMEVSEDMAEAVTLYYDTVLAQAKKAGAKKIHIEELLKAEHVDKDCYGTCDAYFISGDGSTLYVYDYKHGSGVAVDAEGNKQMLYYATMAMQYGFIERIVMNIVQPRCRNGSEEDRVKTWTVDVNHIYAFNEELGARIAETRKKKAKTNAGGWCRFCTAKFKCPSYTKSLVDMFPPEANKDELDLNLPLERYGQMYMNAMMFKERFDKWFTQLSDVLYSAAESGTPAPGTKLVKGRKMRKWQNPSLVEKHFAEYGDAIYSPKKIKSPAQLEKVVGKEEIEDFVNETAPLKLALDSDARPEIKTIEQMFDVIEE